MENVGEVMEEIEEEYLILRDLGKHPNMPLFHGIYMRREGYQNDQIWLVMEVSVNMNFYCSNLIGC